MAPSFPSISKVNLKLLIDTKTNRVLFAEANYEFVDFLFHILSIPLCNVVRLLGKNSMVGSLGNLYDSLENLSGTYMQPNQRKYSILNTKIVNYGAHVPLLSLPNNDVLKCRKFYRCDVHISNVDDVPEGRRKQYKKGKGRRKSTGLYSKSYPRCSETKFVTDVPTTVCPQCKRLMGVELTYVSGDDLEKETGEDGGFVKEMMSYIVMDDLDVKTMSMTSGIAILNMLDVKEVGGLEEMVVSLEEIEGLMLLKASLECKNVLTSVFLA